MQNIYLKNSITIIFLTTPHQHIHLFWYLTLAIFIPPTFLTSNQPTKHAITYALNTRNHTPRGTGQLLDLGLNCYLKIIKPSQTRKPKNTLLRMYHDIHLIRMLLWQVQQQFDWTTTTSQPTWITNLNSMSRIQLGHPLCPTKRLKQVSIDLQKLFSVAMKPP